MFLRQKCKLKIEPVRFIVKPLIAGGVMGAVAIGIYKLVTLILKTGFIGNLVATLLAVGIAAVVYFILVFVFKILSEDEVKQLPAGNKMYSLLVKFGLYK